MASKIVVFQGSLVQAGETLGSVEVHEKVSIGVDSASGKIVFFETGDVDILPNYDVVVIPKGSFLLPGMVDAHIHAPQYAFAGIGTNIPLLDWLNTFTFPFESRCKEDDWAARIFNAVVRRTLSCGTTTAVYFSTLHERASEILAKTCSDLGQRAFVGKVNMDRNCPDFYIEESAQKSLEDTERFIEFCKTQVDADLVAPIITPRFVPTCTAELMKGLAEIARKHGDLAIQSHVSENTGEIAWVAELHPECKSYTDVYKDMGLLTRRTLLAHGVHLSVEEQKTMAAAGASVVHCPLSNFSLTSGVCPVRTLVANGVNIALGTDVCGGASPSILDSMRQALIASQIQKIDKGAAPLGWKDVLYFATRGGAKALGLEQSIGHLAVGMQFDAFVVGTQAQGGLLSSFELFGWESLEQTAEKFVLTGDDRNISSVYVKGRKVYPF